MQVAALRCGHCTQLVTRSILLSWPRFSSKHATVSPWIGDQDARALALAKARHTLNARPMLFHPIPNLVNAPNEVTPQNIFNDEPDYVSRPPPPQRAPVEPPTKQPSQELPNSFAPPVSVRIPRDETSTRQLVFSSMTSQILRHSARSLGYQIVPDGFVRVSDVMRDDFYRHYDLKTFADMCTKDPGDRFELSYLPDYIEGRLMDVLWVRARKNHSIPSVDSRSHRILNMGRLQLIFYICGAGEWDNIRQYGISEGEGHFIPLYRNLAGNIYRDLSIPRKKEVLCVTIDADLAAHLGVMFFSTNSAALQAVGNRDRIIPPAAFRSAILLELNKKELLEK